MTPTMKLRYLRTTYRTEEDGEKNYHFQLQQWWEVALNKQLQIDHDCAWQNNRILEKERQRLEGIVRNGL